MNGRPMNGRRESRVDPLGAPPAVPPDDAVRADLDDAAPVLGSWRAIYAVVLGTLVVLVGLFWLITEAYS